MTRGSSLTDTGLLNQSAMIVRLEVLPVVSVALTAKVPFFFTTTSNCRKLSFGAL